MKGKVLVSIQFLLMFLILLPFNKYDSFLNTGMLFIVFGVIVGILGIKEHPKNNFNIRPDIKESSVLVTTGIYKYIRHPMYFSVIVSMFGVLLLKFSTLKLFLYILLVINMLFKMFYEESLWHNENKEYKEYTKTTKRLIPYIF